MVIQTIHCYPLLFKNPFTIGKKTVLTVEVVNSFLRKPLERFVSKRLTALIFILFPPLEVVLKRPASESTTKITTLNLSLIRINHSQAKRESHVKVPFLLWRCPFKCSRPRVWNRRGGLIIKRRKANLLIFYGCLVLLCRLHVPFSPGLSKNEALKKQGWIVND